MKPNLEPVPKESSRRLTLLEQTRRDFIKATRHLQDAGKRRLKFAPPIKVNERPDRLAAFGGVRSSTRAA
jgi:hypothetical protein